MKLDDIPKKNLFQVPDEYFEQLPGRIQSRVQGRQRQGAFYSRPVLRYALATFLVAAVAFAWVWRGAGGSDAESPETILASLATGDLIAYLDEAEVTTDELLDELPLNASDANLIEEAVFNLELSEADLEDLTQETYEYHAQ